MAADNLSLAKARADRFARSTGMPFEDLYLVAVVGLLKACRRFDPDLRGADGQRLRLSTYAVPVIDGAVCQWLRDRGHSSGVRFPDRWRDRAPTVRRLVADGRPLAEVAAQVGLEVGECREILEAQGATRLADPDAQGFAAPAPQVDEPPEGMDQLQQALEIADEAHLSLSWADQRMLEEAWSRPRRRTLAYLPHGQFMAAATGIIRGVRRVRIEQQQDLAIEIPAAGGSPPRRIAEPRAIVAAAEQLALELTRES